MMEQRQPNWRGELRAMVALTAMSYASEGAGALRPQKRQLNPEAFRLGPFSPHLIGAQAWGPAVHASRS